MQVTLGLHRAAQIAGRVAAVLDGDVHRTWVETGARVARLAGALLRIGVARGDRVAVLMLNGHRYLELYYGLPWMGALVMPLNIRLAAREILDQLADAEAAMLVVDDAFARLLPELFAHMPSVRFVIHASDGEPTRGTLSYEALVAEGPAVHDARIGGDEVFGLFYTGGTTAASKGVMLTHTNIVANAYNAAIALRFDPHEVYLHAAPMFHLADGASTFAITTVAGTHAFVPAFDVVKVLEAIQRYRVRSLLLVPTMINAVVNSPEVANYDLTSLKQIFYGGSPIPGAVMAKAVATLGCGLSQGYGMTETAPILTVLPPEDHVLSDDPERRARLKSAGLPVPQVDVEIHDDQDRPLPRGEVGEVCARGPNVMKGYWRKPDASATALRGGFMHTGDLGYLDEDGYLYLVDRAKDMIVTGGENVFSIEVEAALYSHPDVLEAAVFGIPHSEWGEQVHAIVVPKPGCSPDPDALIAHCRQLIALYKCPKTIQIQSDALPKSGAGKILKRALRAPFWEGHERQIH